MYFLILIAFFFFFSHVFIYSFKKIYIFVLPKLELANNLNSGIKYPIFF